jgi:hypothetical protein
LGIWVSLSIPPGSPNENIQGHRTAIRLRIVGSHTPVFTEPAVLLTTRYAIESGKIRAIEVYSGATVTKG